MMVPFTRKENIGLLDRFAPILVVLAFLGLVLSYPPPATGADPLFGVGSPVSVGLVLPPPTSPGSRDAALPAVREPG